MNRLFLTIALAGACVFSTTVTAEAQSQRALSRVPAHVSPGGNRPAPATSVPELDPNAAGAALALLLGSVAVLMAGRRREA